MGNSVEVSSACLLESRQGRLWSREVTEGPSNMSREDLCKQDSSSSTDTQSTVRLQTDVPRLRRERRNIVQNLKVSSLETETMSQDSGYHGCLRQKSLEKESQRRCKYFKAKVDKRGVMLKILPLWTDSATRH